MVVNALALGRWFDAYRREARPWQISGQLTLLCLGVLLFDFSLTLSQIVIALSAALATQAVWLNRLALNQIGYASAAITGCGVALLLRADTLWAHALTACLAISSKFVLRHSGKHIWNPANFGIALALLLLPGVWLSPGQWAQSPALAFLAALLGVSVVWRARQLALSLCFLGCFVALALCRWLYLGYEFDRLWVLLGKLLSNGGLIVFAFFMVSDPITRPNHPIAAYGYVALVAVMAFAWQFIAYQPNGLIWSLFLLAPLTLGCNRLWPSPAFRWRAASDDKPAHLAQPIG